MKKLLLLLFFIPLTLYIKAQTGNCTFLKPLITIHFGKGNVQEINSQTSFNYSRVGNSCPQDGHYSYVSYTSDCFGGDWHTITEDHTSGDADGNMMLINASHRSGTFFSTPVNGLKAGTTYEFAVWMMNVCRISDKCPYPLLPDIAIRLLDVDRKIITQVSTGELQRQESPTWTQYKAVFTTPSTGSGLILNMINYSPGGCGNDFVMDDITFRECIITPPPVAKKTVPPTATKPVTRAVAPPAKKPASVSANPNRNSTAAKPTPKKSPATTTAKKQTTPEIISPSTNSRSAELQLPKQKAVFPPPPKVLTTRANPLVTQIETEEGDISVALYDNGEIDGDTVSIYHNNQLLVSRARLSQQPISFKIKVDDEHPHHELIMVAENLGSIPPNTSVMIVYAGTKKYELFISSSEQKNAKVVFDLK